MTEPTIDEMLAWLSPFEEKREGHFDVVRAIRAILEQRLFYNQQMEKKIRDPILDLEAVRAFVERVEKRLPDYDTGRGADSWLRGYRSAVEDELNAMEAEVKE